MTPRYPSQFVSRQLIGAKLAEIWHRQTLSLKAVSFALIGLLNTAVDYGVFLLAQAAYQRCARHGFGIRRAGRRPAAAAPRRPLC